MVERPRRRILAITFTDANFKALDPDQDDLMVISVELAMKFLPDR